MGFLGKMVAKAVVKKVETAAMYDVVNHMENTRSVDALVNKGDSGGIVLADGVVTAIAF